MDAFGGKKRDPGNDVEPDAQTYKLLNSPKLSLAFPSGAVIKRTIFYFFNGVYRPKGCFLSLN